MRKKIIAASAAALLLLAGCDSEADVAAQNLATEAEQFRIERRIVVFNGITDTYLLAVTGRCSIEDQGDQVEITCKTGPDSYKKHLAGLSDNTSYFVEQLEPVPVDVYRYKVLFRPTTIVPDVEVAVP